MNTSLRLAFVLLACSLAPAANRTAEQGPAGGAAPMFDCNDNGVEDTVDIAIGSSSDADRDGVPDECQAGDERPK